MGIPHTKKDGLYIETEPRIPPLAVGQSYFIFNQVFSQKLVILGSWDPTLSLIWTPLTQIWVLSYCNGIDSSRVFGSLGLIKWDPREIFMGQKCMDPCLADTLLNASKTTPQNILLDTWRNNNIIITSKRHRDVFLRNDDVIIASFVRWVGKRIHKNW